MRLPVGRSGLGYLGSSCIEFLARWSAHSSSRILAISAAMSLLKSSTTSEGLLTRVKWDWDWGWDWD